MSSKKKSPETIESYLLTWGDIHHSNPTVVECNLFPQDRTGYSSSLIFSQPEFSCPWLSKYLIADHFNHPYNFLGNASLQSWRSRNRLPRSQHITSYILASSHMSSQSNEVNQEIKCCSFRFDSGILSYFLLQKRRCSRVNLRPNNGG